MRYVSTLHSILKRPHSTAHHAGANDFKWIKQRLYNLVETSIKFDDGIEEGAAGTLIAKSALELVLNDFKARGWVSGFATAKVTRDWLLSTRSVRRPRSGRLSRLHISDDRG